MFEKRNLSLGFWTKDQQPNMVELIFWVGMENILPPGNLILRYVEKKFSESCTMHEVYSTVHVKSMKY